jgi:hypothetical protein
LRLDYCQVLCYELDEPFFQGGHHGRRGPQVLAAAMQCWAGLPHLPVAPDGHAGRKHSLTALQLVHTYHAALGLPA